MYEKFTLNKEDYEKYRQRMTSRKVSEKAVIRRKEMAAMRVAGMTLQEIGNKYGISRERVRQILLSV